MVRKILSGLDGSEGSFRALGEALALAKALEVELHTISVEEVPRYPGTMGEVIEAKQAANGTYQAVLSRARTMAREQGVKLKEHLRVGHEVKTIVEYLREEQFDLLVIGFMGHSALYERVMGGTCQNLVRLAPCSVLVVK